VRTYFFEHQAQFDTIAKVLLYRHAKVGYFNDEDAANPRIKQALTDIDYFSIDLWMNGNCDTTGRYAKVQIKMNNWVYIDGMKMPYYYIYTKCLKDSFRYESNNTIEGYLTPHWTYFIEKNL